MKTNMGGIDRTLRINVGLGLLTLLFILERNVRWWGLVGFIPLLTGFTGWSPAYLPFGISTCKTGKDEPVSA